MSTVSTAGAETMVTAFDLRDAVPVRVIVLGAGVAGCAAALAFARGAHEVVVLDRGDMQLFDGWSADEVFQRWQRRGIAQFRQPHNFLGLARALLRDRFADVYAAVREMGATEVKQDSFLCDAAREAGDEDLATVACRRPVFDAALLTAVAAQPQVTHRATEVIGLRLRPRGHAAHVVGVELANGESMTADLVVDAAGRRSRTSDWLSAAGARPLPSVSSECGLLYYSRHYRFRDGEPIPPYASLLGGPRGDLGYLAFATFLGDNRTFCLSIMVPPWDRAFRELRGPAAFQRIAVRLPGLAAWLEPSNPVSGVLPMGQLRNQLLNVVDDNGPLLTGLIPIGDARCHTNPTFAFGASLSLWHAVRLADLADRAIDDIDLVTYFESEVGADVSARFYAVSAEDRDRARWWSGEPIDITDPAVSLPLFLRFIVYPTAARDPALLRAVARRINALDPVERLAGNPELLDRARALHAESAGDRPSMPRRSLILAALAGDPAELTTETNP
jgi:2-polyprenyl-6-methoxyphenol hydroxylase-like FAD-dependent oxidoreductase